MRGSAGGKEDTAVAGLWAEGEVPSSVVGVNCTASESSLASGNVGCDTQVGTVTKRMWA
jgi:hypothetical protein